MATTTNYALEKPTVGGDTDTWGGKLNDNMDAIDAQMKVNADAVAALGDPVAVAKGGTGATTASAARTNLGLGTAATQADTKYAFRANNLSDLNNTAAALTNLGGLRASNNLSDVANSATARTNLGAVATTRAINAGSGLTGGGNLTADRTLSINVGVTAGTGLTGGGTLTATRTISLDTTLGAVGTYAFLAGANGATITAGSTYSGAALSYAGIDGSSSSANALVDAGSSPAGTWRAMGGGVPQSAFTRIATLFQRIS